MEPVLEKEAVVFAPVADVWHAWTTTSGVKTFFAPQARVELKEGGAYEMYFLLDEEPGSRGSEGCTITEFEPEQKLAYTWNFPPTLPSIRNEHTLVTVTMEPAGADRTRVVIRQTGWKEGPDWDQGFRYFQRAWMLVLARLEHRFAKGPLDWSDPYTPEGL